MMTRSFGRALVATTLMLVGLQAQAALEIRGQKVELSRENRGLLLQKNENREWVIQFGDLLRPETRREMKAHGLEILRYLPPNGFLVRGDGRSLELIQAQKVIGSAAWQPQWKIDSELAKKIAARAFLADGEKKRPLRLWVMAFDETSAQRLSADLRRMSINHKVEGRTLDALAEVEKIVEIAKLPGVENIEEAPQVEAMHMNLGTDIVAMAAGKGDYTDVTGFETGTKVMNFEAVWAQGLSGQGEIVSFADTGLDMGAIDTVSMEFRGGIKSGQILGIGAKDWSDPMGHGTHVAGSIAGRGTASKGVFKGGAYDAMLMPQGMWSPLIDNLTVPPKLDKMFQPAFNDGARLHSNSWGSPRNLGAYDAMAAQVDDYVWKNPEFLPIFAAGNSGVDKNADGIIDLGSISSPGTSKNSLTVGASENYNLTGGIQAKIGELRSAKESWPAEPISSSKLSDDANGISVFSSRGPTSDGRLKPEIVGPGSNILSAKSKTPTAQLLWGAYNDEYVYSGGTSMSTPLVAGGAAIAREVLRTRYNMARPSGALVKAVLLHTAVDLAPGQYGTGPKQELKPRPDNNQGYGRSDMAMLGKLGAQTQMIDEKTGLGTGEVMEYRINVNAGETLLVNLVYADAPGTPSASRALVNNLDLEVSGPGGHLSNTDSLNNNAMIELKKAPAGAYIVRVRGQNIPMGNAGKQPFALVLSALL
ncbi:MAG: S8 family serine peptidase [Bdellovibrionaceae bacterium]|nr:S8 family serine peptidase [Pseudobdellovibrionaceae bacterium]